MTLSKVILLLFFIECSHAFVSRALPRFGKVQVLQAATSTIKKAAPVEMVVSAVELDDSNFEDILRGSKPVMIKSYAPWCGPCKLIQPVVDKCAEAHEDSLVVCNFNVEAKNPNLKLELAMNEVLPRSLPTLILFDGQGSTAVHKGVIDENGLDEFLASNLPNWKASGPAGTQTEGKKSGFLHLASNSDDYMLKQDGI